jgi:Helix-turn-helix domain
MTLARARKRNGRSKKQGRFWAVPHFMLQTHAWRRLSPYARAAWLEIGALYVGDNNGRIAVPARWLADRLNVSKNTAMRAILELMTLGFLEKTQSSSFTQKRRAAEYRFTHLKCNRTGDPPSRTFQNIRPNGPDFAQNESPIGARREPISPVTLRPP